MGMEMTNKRQAERHEFRMKAQVQPLEVKAFRPVHTWTQDVSSKGLFLEIDQPLQHGTRVLLTLELPAEVTGKPVLMRCVSRVVRVVNRPNRKFGVGTVIESYELVRKLEAPPSNGRHARPNGKSRF